MSRPSKFNDSVKDLVLKLAKQGQTDEQVAEYIGISVRTLHNWKGRHPDFFDALKEAKSVADDLVEASLFQRAIGYSHKEIKVFCFEGSIVTHEIEKYYAPDVTACIFWLKNRRPEEWRDRVEHQVDTTKPIVLKYSLESDDEKKPA